MDIGGSKLKAQQVKRQLQSVKNLSRPITPKFV
jgi:hypothetical protein